MSDTNLVQLFKSELELCRLREGESVGIYSEGGALSDYAEAFARAAGDLGAQVMHVDIPLAAGRSETEIGTRKDVGMRHIPQALDALKRCDLVVDLTFLLFTPELEVLKDAGARVLTCTGAIEEIVRLFPDEDIRRRAREGEEILDQARVVEFTTSTGTDVRFELGQFRAYCQYGIADEPGRWDNFSSAMSVNNPNDGGTEGVVVLSPGDIAYPWRRKIKDRVEFVIRRGRIVEIRGGEEAAAIRDYMASFDDERAYAIGHIGWGANQNALWEPSSELEPRSFYASVMFSTGPNVEFGGDNDTLCHLDLPIQRELCTLKVDGKEIIVDGKVMVPSLVAPGDQFGAAA